MALSPIMPRLTRHIAGLALLPGLSLWGAAAWAQVTTYPAPSTETGTLSVYSSLDDALAVVARIVARTDLPVTMDFEGGYAPDRRRYR